MTSSVTDGFRSQFVELPGTAKRQARWAFRRFLKNPSHPSLRFKKVHPKQPIYSARLSRDYRAVCVHEGDEFVWFWIGPHDEYDRLLKNWRRRKS